MKLLARAFVVGVCALGLLPLRALANPPAGYYDLADTTNSTTLRQTLHDIIDDHVFVRYTSTSLDTWDVLEAADEDPNDTSSILDLYKNASYVKVGGGTGDYNREHSWPKSYGFPEDSSTQINAAANSQSNYPYTDCHHLFLCDIGYNSSRGNVPYDTCNVTCTEKVTDVNNGQGGGSGVYPGNSNWRTGSGNTGTWETWGARRGDVARALLYMDVRYDGTSHSLHGAVEPDLILTDDDGLIFADASNNQFVAYMGILSTLLLWHVEDPVDDLERQHHEEAFGAQTNRNPFIDHPEWVDCVFSNNCNFGCSVPAYCDDGLFCNGAEDCVGGTCQSGSDPCPGQGCDEVADVCVPMNCNDDGVCDAGEDCNNCPNDCPSLGADPNNGICETADGEDCLTAPDDCNFKLNGNPNNRYCCGDGAAEYGVTCGDSRCTANGNTCTDVPAPQSCCGDGVCEGAENIPNCAVDCAECTIPAECDDSNPCTIDDCVANACSNVPLDCDDGDACTDDTCSGGACFNDPTDCDDGDLCTFDGCDSVSGCFNDPLDCDDGDACTVDACSGGVCFNDPIDCDDGESCTTDSCDLGSGCLNTWPGCGTADGCCGPACSAGNDPDCCQPSGGSCSQNSECCSNRCKGNGTCK